MVYMTTKTSCFTSTSSDATEKLAAEIGERLKGGELIELTSDLGGGKTTFVRGLARGMGSQDKVSSPTFTISKVYRAVDKELHHFDFYRLPEAGIIAEELAEVINQPDIVVVVEWGEIVRGVLAQDRVTVTFTPSSEDERQIMIKYPKSLEYLIEGIQC